MYKIKIVSRAPDSSWLRYFPDASSCKLGDCEFIFDKNCDQYDWLVVYEDFPKIKDGSGPGSEKLACHAQNTLLITTEPPSIKWYDKEYTEQFGYVLTSQPPEDLPHRNRIYSQPALMWFFSDKDREWDFLSAELNDCTEKNKILSTVCSSKRQKHTLHNRRYDLTMELDSRLPEMDVFGRGIKHVESKYQMMKAYKYHLAIENYHGPHHWTEKLSDSFLSSSLPFYYGCSNLQDYFPEESYIEIDLWDTDKTRDIISEAIADNAYEKRFDAIMEAKRRVLEEYGIFTQINKIVTENNLEAETGNEVLLSRHAIRKKYPLTCYPRILKKEVIQAIKSLSLVNESRNKMKGGRS